ncbi:Sensory box histidine kinase [Desulfosporosinus sp. I2]|uniref:PAS domain-containing sensor histidine kinase n=1 Tax=Desulfosporosinus sp. I2 TaxID=1617025 RepID=UPI0005ED95C9|nr:PAS domain-containing sensor histidine kinase [Desulfosporosinus sp. I2]KJR46753.1 Sensory box histidine kinase [Desulfosporosinus sp. I2]
MQIPFPWWARIKGRVLVFGVAMSIFPLLFLGLASFNAAKLNLERNIQEENYERATAFANQIREFVDNMANSLTHVASTNSTVLTGSEPEARLMVLGTLLREEPYLDAVKIADPRFRVLSEVARREVVLPAKGPEHLENLSFDEANRYSISAVFFSPDGRPEFYLTVAIRDTQTRRVIGYLQAKTDLKGMITKLANRRIGQAGYFFLTDEQGNLIGHTDFSHVLRRENIRQNPSVAAFLEGRPPMHEGSEYANPAGLKVMGLYAPVGNPNWAVFIEQPLSEAYEPIYEFARKLILIVLAAISSVTLISIVFGLKLTRPIENLDAEVRSIIATGELTRVIPRQSQDEVGRLILSFNRLLSMLDERNRNLKAEKELLTTVVGGIGAGMALLDADKRVLWWNSIFAEWFGTDDLQNLPCEQILIGEGFDCLLEEKDRVISLDVHGKPRFIRQMYYELAPGNPDNAAYLLILEDVTQRVEMDAHMIETDKMAAVGLLASGIAHEINNPLAVVSAHSEDLLDRLNETGNDAPDLAEVQNVLHIVSKQILRCKTITNRLLHFARKGKKGRDLFDIGVATAQTTALLGHQAKQKQIRLESRLEEGLWVWGNENEWQQVILNLMNNALDASSAGGAIEVRAWRDRAAAEIHLEIQDQGHGIPPSQIKKVFDPFFTTKPPGQGTGLGLFVSYGIIQKMNGHLALESTPGQGTTVKITLPTPDGSPKKALDTPLA